MKKKREKQLIIKFMNKIFYIATVFLVFDHKSNDVSNNH